jgi:hypothetical protein
MGSPEVDDSERSPPVHATQLVCCFATGLLYLNSPPCRSVCGVRPWPVDFLTSQRTRVRKTRSMPDNATYGMSAAAQRPGECSTAPDGAMPGLVGIEACATAHH